MTAILSTKAISKAFHGNIAVDQVDFDLFPGEIHALLGENGAGKSTFSKLLAGVYPPDSGEIRLAGQPFKAIGPGDALGQRIAMVYQETSLVPSMTVAQNLFLGQEKAFNRLRGVTIAAQQFLQSLNFTVDPTALVSSLGAAKRQMVEIARAVRLNARIIIFDEPTATLTPEERRHFFALLARLQKRGVAIIFITHALEEALQVSDRITVMRDGKRVLTAAAQGLTQAGIIEAMVGRDVAADFAPRDSIRPPGARVLSVEDVSMGALVRNTSFSVFAGQVTGLFGLVGSGRTETAKIIAGVLKRDFLRGGQVEYQGGAVRYATPGPAVADGIVYVTEDRKQEGFFENMTVAENLYAGLLAAGLNRFPWVSTAEMRELAAQWSARLVIRSIDPGARVVELSGGNQQKVVIGKALIQNPKLVIFDEPTRGVDIGAVAEIHALIESLAEQGIAVIVISSYLPEILKLSDRILVCRQGRVVEEFSPTDASSERILYAAVH
ncbi:sugar ABC transporter ATP-binding protein [Rhodobacter sp. 24-YEA-8]|uniref:sugar ABC transporter ATP-binding protein n=1 Tax=Rhodobacter sp. 24-YEA-8 TaxID=1884310 RepID=UPI00089864BE|nr:sugar ABC transporter ATP-binding protein [Rhodobacter sp. 24-YEA-8]SED25736.1 simple sugar transport system ATP-binding protein [Rhodobacter sp. 24-YEA-8]